MDSDPGFGLGSGSGSGSGSSSGSGLSFSSSFSSDSDLGSGSDLCSGSDSRFDIQFATDGSGLVLIRIVMPVCSIWLIPTLHSL